MTDPLAPLLDPMADLARQNAEFDWGGNNALKLDERYRQRQLPLLGNTPRTGLGPDVRPAEFWPPVRSAVAPLDGHMLAAAPQLSAFLDDLRGTGLNDLVWWSGLARRVDRVHATVAPDLDRSDGWPAVTAYDEVTVVVRGPWIGRFNTGRIYLPVQATDPSSAATLAGLRTRTGAAHRPLLAGYLQLTDDVTGARYGQLRDLIATYRDRIAVRLAVTELWLMDTMDDLVLRSQVVAKLSLTATAR